ncbi:MAG: hypothetical protein NTY74_06080 [Ignavibacteriae bacterium]|nr:hypothetical protein [Ignavibacteriota bacterium]
MSKEYINIIMGSGEWNLYHRKEFTKEIINNGEEIAFVNLPVSLLVNLFIKFWSRFVAYFTGKYKVNNETGFFIFTPLMLTHYLLWRKSPILASIDSHFVSIQINRFVRKYYPNRKIRLWLYMPEQKYLVGKVKYDLLIYDSYDDCDLNFDGTINRKRAELNQELIKESDFLIVISKYTYDKYSKYAKNIFRSRGGYSCGVFKSSSQKINITDSNKPVLGYVGTFRNWIDYTLINRLIDSNEFILCFIGYIDRSSKNYFENIIKNKNVIHINYVDISKIPLYMKNFSVGLIPFKVNDFMRSVYPNKFFEYISLNIPVVTTALPELETFKDYIALSENNDEFIENCKKAVRGEYSNKISRYPVIMENNDWNSIVNEIVDEIRKLD